MMKSLKRLLKELNRSWFLEPKTVPTVVIRKGSGLHTKVTVRDGELHLHSAPYQRDMPIKQTITLDSMSMEELINLLTSMGYEAEFTSEALKKGTTTANALNVFEVDNADIKEGTTFEAFTSNLWRVLYPIARILAEADRNVDKAIEQIPLTSAKGRWLDFWVSFFNVKRLEGESDELLLKRSIMFLANVKANNIAMEELVSYYIQTSVSIKDHSPSYLIVSTEPQFMESADKVRNIIDLLKSAGVDYFLDYADKYEESYPSLFRSKHGKTFKEVNKDFRRIETTFKVEGDSYAQVPDSQVQNAFILNNSRLGGSKRLSLKDTRFTEKLTMVMTQNGTIIKQGQGV